MFNLKRYLPRIMSGVPFWTDFMDVVSGELDNLKALFDLKRAAKNVREQDSIEGLRFINREFGVRVDLTLFEREYQSLITPVKEYMAVTGIDTAENIASLGDLSYVEEIVSTSGNNADVVAYRDFLKSMIDYLRIETEGIAFKVQHKATYDYMNYIFERLGEKGFTYILYSDDTGTLFRGVKFTGTADSNVLRRLENHDITQPFHGFIPEIPNPDGVIESVYLDNSPMETLDDASSWQLDNQLVGRSVKITSHIASEFVADELITIDGTDYLLTPTHFDYLRRALNYGRKATDVPHAGVQITGITDESGSINIVSGLNISTLVTGDYNPLAKDPIEDFYKYVVVGDSGNAYMKAQLAVNEIFSDPTYGFDVVHKSFPAFSIFPESLGTGAGVQATFNHTFAYPSIRPGTIRISYIESGTNKTVTARDDGEGNLYFDSVSDIEVDGYSGSVNYTTGEITFYTFNNTASYDPANNTSIDARYQTYTDFKINQAFLLDSTETTVVQCTFPPVWFGSPEDHLSIQFIVKKTA